MDDIILDNDFDLLFENGDFVVSDSTAQNQKILIYSDKGEFKENPLTGVGAKRYLEDHTPERLARSIREEFTKDGMKVNQIIITEDANLQIEANYES